MKVFNFVILGLLILPSIHSRAQPPSKSDVIDVKGRIIDSRTKNPIEGAAIGYIWNNRIVNAKEKSKKDGTFELIGYPGPLNAVDILVEKEGYKPELVLTKITNKIIPDIELISYSKIIKGQVRNYRTKELMKNVEIIYRDFIGVELIDIKVPIAEGWYSINTKKNSGNTIDIRVSSRGQGIKNLEHTLTVPEDGDFEEIQLFLPKRSKGWKIGLSIGAVVSLGGGVVAKLISDNAYDEYTVDVSAASREDKFRQAENWNRASIISTVVGAGCAIGLTYVIGKNNGNRSVPKIF